jgi:hypothetical protein
MESKEIYLDGNDRLDAIATLALFEIQKKERMQRYEDHIKTHNQKHGRLFERLLNIGRSKKQHK